MKKQKYSYMEKLEFHSKRANSKTASASQRLYSKNFILGDDNAATDYYRGNSIKGDEQYRSASAAVKENSVHAGYKSGVDSFVLHINKLNKENRNNKKF